MRNVEQIPQLSSNWTQNSFSRMLVLSEAGLLLYWKTFFTTDGQKGCLMVDYPRHCFSKMLDKTKRQGIENSNSCVSPLAIFIFMKYKKN